MKKISVVINTKNEERNLKRVVSSVKGLADEVVVVDMKSTDETLKLAKKLGCKVFSFDDVGYVEPARNYAVSKTLGEWVLILDADEEVGGELSGKIKKITEKGDADYFRIPRKNIIFGKWIRHTKWWPDYQVRLFKRGMVSWGDEIHSFPITTGKGVDLPVKESYAIIHHNYQTITQYLERMHRYSSIQSRELVNSGYKFVWKDILKKPLTEFIGRFFTGEGYKDGLHGLALSSLQAFSECLVYLKVWENEKFLEQSITPKEVAQEFGQLEAETNWWVTDMIIKNSSTIKSIPARIKRKIKHGKRK